MEAIYSKIIKAGERTYFIDVREARNKSRYVSISCTSPDGLREDERVRFKRDKVVIFAEELFEVALAIAETVNNVQTARAAAELSPLPVNVLKGGA